MEISDLYEFIQPFTNAEFDFRRFQYLQKNCHCYNEMMIVGRATAKCMRELSETLSDHMKYGLILTMIDKWDIICF
jgi:hypothetical protein